MSHGPLRTPGGDRHSARSPSRHAFTEAVAAVVCGTRSLRWPELRLRLSLVVRAVSLALASSQLAAQSAHARAPSIDDLTRLREISELAVSPDGHWAAYVMRAPVHSDTVEQPTIVLLDLHRMLSRTVKLSAPPHGLAWADRGDLLGFMSASHGRSQIWSYSPRDTGATPVPVAVHDSLGGDILAFAWDPAGTRVAYLAAERGAPGHGSSRHAPAPPRLVLFHDSPGDYTGQTSPAYSRDTAGVYVALDRLGSEQAHVLVRHLVSASDGPRIAWSESGKLLVNGTAMNVGWVSQIISGLLYVIDASTGEVAQEGPTQHARKDPAWSPSGRWIADVRFEFLPDKGLLPNRYTLQVENAEHFGETIAFPRETDGLASTFPPVWAPDDRTVYIGRYQDATGRLFAVDMATRRWRALTPDTLSLSRYAISHDGTVLLVVLENPNQPQELYRLDASSGALTKLTDNARALPPMRLGHVEQLAWRSRDTRFTIHGFLVTPPGYDPTRRYPLIVIVHGGPGYPFISSFVGIGFAPLYVPPQLLASAGYLVLLPNPRGDPSYGEEFVKALHDDWGPGPFADIRAGIDTLIRRGRVDSTAVGIAGSSYGGYLTAYAIAHSQRFAAASINDGPTDLVSDYGQNYATRAQWAKATFDGPPWTRRAVYVAQSPITYVSRVRTPTIMRYGGRSSTDDNIRLSYMLGQGFEFYAGLRDTGVPVEFVLHPDQGHGINDWGLYKDWIQRNLRWFDYWIRHRGTDPIASAPS